MKLHETIPYSLKQLLRTPMKIVLYFVLPLLAAAFLCLGLNLYQYASSNLNAVYTTFDVTAPASRPILTATESFVIQQPTQIMLAVFLVKQRIMIFCP